MDPMVEEGFRGPQVCKIVDITYRQLDYWASTTLVTPSINPAKGSGSQRLYSFENLVYLRLIKKLLDTGVSLQRIRRAIMGLREFGADLRGVTLASDGKTVYACTTAEEIFDLLRNGQGVFGIALDPVMKELEGTVKEMGREVAQHTAVADEPAPGVVRFLKAGGEE